MVLTTPPSYGTNENDRAGKAFRFVSDSEVDRSVITQKFKTLFSSLDQNYFDKLPTPEGVIVNILQQSDIARYSRFYNRMTLPLRFVADSALKSETVMKAIYCHEYAHVYFHHYMFAQSTTYRQNYLIIHRYRSIKIALRQANAAQQKDLIRQKKALKSQYEVAHLDALFVKAYNELFADIVAVVATNDKDAMWKATNDKADRDYGKTRSFSVHHPVHGWKLATPYNLLSPTRTHLGAHQFKSIGVVKPSLSVAHILEVMIAEIDKTRKTIIVQHRVNPHRGVMEYDVKPEEVNLSLIAALDRLL